MYASLVFALSFPIGAPGKDVPKAEPTIVGVWLREKATAGGADQPEPAGGTRFTLTADGKFLMKQGERAEREEGSYKVDAKKDPAEIDFMPRPGKDGPPVLGIYKLDGDTLTICIARGDGKLRPTKFEAPEGSANILMTLKRAKKEK